MCRSALLTSLLAYLNPDGEIPNNDQEKWLLFRSLVNVRAPAPVCTDFLQAQDMLLQEMIADKGITDASALKPVRADICLWKGDITTLKADAIVNAANSQMLGCFYPCHACIDNAIHTFAGVQLRLACAQMVDGPVPVGQVMMTSAYNLPSRYILHTVGPFIAGQPTQADCLLLARCYRACLEKAKASGLRSIAFCCLSTGEFHFPQKKAAEIAVRTIGDNPGIRVIFTVFTDTDYQIYHQLLNSATI